MRTFLLFCFCLFSFSLFSQKKVDFFVESDVRTGFIETSSLQFLEFEYLLWCFAGPISYFNPSQSYRTATDLSLSLGLNAGMIVKDQWYFSTGIRRDVKKITNEVECNFCEGDYSYYHTKSQSIEIPLAIRYRVIPDLRLSPLLMAETMLAFREVNNYRAEEPIYGVQETANGTFTGYRFGVGLNYQVNTHLELTVHGSWGKTLLLDRVFDGKSDESVVHGEVNSPQMTDYQLGFSVIYK